MPAVRLQYRVRPAPATRRAVGGLQAPHQRERAGAVAAGVDLLVAVQAHVDERRRHVEELRPLAGGIGHHELARRVIGDLLEHLRVLDERIGAYDRELEAQARQCEPAQRFVRFARHGCKNCAV